MGATGAVGEEMLQILEQRNFPVKELRLLASARSVGKKYTFQGREIAVEELKETSFKDIDIVLASAGGSISKKFAPFAVKEGAVIIDNTSAFRMDPDIPLVIPEINPKDIKKYKKTGIIANPNCSTIIMLVPLWPIFKMNKIKRILVSTYQAASGAGAKAMQELENQSHNILTNKPTKKKIFPHQITFNLFSHNNTITNKNYNKKKLKMIKKTKN
jgi:aspartate-semialdehyde dehydrogenase